MATAKHFYSANEVLERIQNLPSDESGEESASSDNDSEAEVELLEHRNDSAMSSVTESDEEFAALRDRIPITRGNVDAVTCGRRCRRPRRRSCRTGNGRGHVAAEQPVGADLDGPMDPGLQPGKDGTQWLLVKAGAGQVRRAPQNILTVAPGPRRHIKSSITNLLEAFMTLIDVTMMSWIVTYTQAEATR